MSKASILTCVFVALTSLCASAGIRDSAGNPGPGPIGDDSHTVNASILQHDVVVSIGKLLNEKHAGRCVLPSQETDIQWGCMGALVPVKKPTIQPSSCFFRVKIDCPSEVAEISGVRTTFFLQMPSGQASQVEPSRQVIEITNVNFKAK